MVREEQQDTSIERKLEIIEKLSALPKLKWITEETREIHESHKVWRESILMNKSKWNYFDYCNRYAHHYYNIALLYYSYFSKYKINFNIIKISIEKSLSKLNGIRSTDREKARTEELFAKVSAFKAVVDEKYIELQNRLDTEDRIKKVKTLINLGQIEYDNLNFFQEEDLSNRFGTYLLGVLLINFISEIEENLSLHLDKDHYSKFNICKCVARAYEICGQQTLRDAYLARSSQQITLAFEDLGRGDKSADIRKQIRGIIKEQLKLESDLPEIYEVIKNDYRSELSSLDCCYVEKKFVKYCMEAMFTEIRNTLTQMARSNNEFIFARLMTNLEQLKSIEDFYEDFQYGRYYKLLMQHKRIVTHTDYKFCLKKYKNECKFVLSGKLEEQQKELDFLKQLIVFFRTISNHRNVINDLQMTQFCNKTISFQHFLTNIGNLSYPGNEELSKLKTLTNLIEEKSSLFFMDKFINTLQSYAFPPVPAISEEIITLEGKLIIFSEIINTVLLKKPESLTELRIVGADILCIDESLDNNHWAGVNILIVAKTINIQGKQVLNVSGRNAENFKTTASIGIAPKQDGKNGKDGLSGQSGGDIYISCCNINNSEDLTIISHGGNGGNGQTGGNGACGENGEGIILSEFENLTSPPDPSYNITENVVKALSAALGIIIRTDKTFDLAKSIEKLQQKTSFPNIPLPKVAKNVKIFSNDWSESLFRLNIWNKAPCYFDGKDEFNRKVTYSYYPSRIFCKQEVLILYEGTDASAGGRGGTGGKKGNGGLAGDVIIKCKSPANVNVKKTPGKDGKKGLDGQTGKPGKNGWDMGFVLVNGWWKSTTKFIGKNQDLKFTMKYHQQRHAIDFVYSPYRHKKLLQDDYFVEIRERDSATNVYDQILNKEQRNDEQVKATRAKAINRNVISQYEDATDIVDELTHLILELEETKEQVLEEIVEEDEEKESEMTNFQVHRQAIFEDYILNQNRKILRRRKKITQVATVSDYVEQLNANPSNINLWLGLKNVVVESDHLDNLFLQFFSKKEEFRHVFSDIYTILINKYKVATCQKIFNMNKYPQLVVHFTPEPIEKYLIFDDSKIKEFTHENLGILREYFRENHHNLLKGLQDYLQNVDVGRIFYPLKFFIMEKSSTSEEFKSTSKNVLDELNKFESRLERLVQCYQVAYQQDPYSSMFKAIEERKNDIVKNFKLEIDCTSVVEQFIEYVGVIGMSSTAVRELLACAFNTNIKIFILDTEGKLILYHDHNPTAKDVCYLFLEHGTYIEFRMDDAFVNLLSERKILSKHYSQILSVVNKFVHKKDFDEFVQNFDNFNGCDTVNNYITFKKLSEGQIIEKICIYFPANEKNTIFSALKKLQYKYIGSINILCALLQRFDIEGLYISSYEMLFTINAILKSVIENNYMLEIFEWIICAAPQDHWINNCFYFMLENYFKKSLKSTRIRQYLTSIKQKYIILLMAEKLREATDTIRLKNITICFDVLSQIEVDEDILRCLPLSKWQYTLREQYIEFKLSSISKWESNEQLLKALYYLNCLESNIGSKLINKLLEILHKRKEVINSKVCLELFSLLHREEWTLDYPLINKIDCYGVHRIKNELQEVQLKLDDERSLESLLELILKNSHTPDEIKSTLKMLRNRRVLGLHIDTPYSESKIRGWVKRFQEDIHGMKRKRKEEFIKNHFDDILEMILHAIKLRKGFLLRTTQRLAILLMLVHEQNILSQISTGEGKSLIVVAVSIFRALCGQKVDIITSSSVLAIRDATIHKDIFDIFNISVNHNCSEKLDERRDAYTSCPVIFGDLSNFQRDFLLDRFYEKNILGNRNFETLIVDEVDNMLLDKGNNTLYLSHEIPTLDKLESVYLFLWKRIAMSVGRKNNNFETILKQDVLFDLYGTLSTEDLEANLDLRSNMDANAIYKWLKEIKVVNHRHHVLKQIAEKDVLKIDNKYKIYLHKLQYIIEKTLNRQREIKIPQSLYNFVELHLDVWIKNGLLAVFMEEGHDYVVDVDRTHSKSDINPNITIIDKGTGTDQSNSQWEEALHQFLQLKHGCKISTQSLKAVFLSNVNYFKKYNKLYGLTGTLGSQVEKELLEELYNVQFVNIPTAKPKRFVEHEAILCATETDWQFRIVNKVKELTNEDRSVLIICETIKKVNTLAKAFQQDDVGKKIIYKREYEECLLAQGMEELEGGNVIIATNLAGRGTDIKITDNLNQKGGLHVLLTYLPNNTRIEQQAFGRAARSGCNGSGQLIIIGYGSFLNKRKERDHEERQRIVDIKIFFDTKIKIEEKFFTDFTDVYKSCNKLKVEQKLKEIAAQRTLDRWAFWIDEFGTKLSETNTEKIFEVFKNDLKNNFTKWEKWDNDPIQKVQVGLHYIKEKKLDNAIEVFNSIIKKEPEFCEAAHYYKAAALSMKLDFEKRPFKGDDLKMYDEFVTDLRNAARLFEVRKDVCISSSAFIQNLKQNMKNSFMTIDAYKSQQDSMTSLYDFYIRSINNILGHTVTKTSFISQEIERDYSEEIYDKLIKKSVLKKSRIVKACLEDINAVSNSFGISNDKVSEFLKSYENKDIQEEEFLEDLKREIKMPCLEECWDTFINESKLTNELKFVIITKSKLTTIQEEVLNTEPQVKINLKTNEGKHVWMKQFISTNPEDHFIFEEKIIKPLSIYNTLKKENLLEFNRIAEFQFEKISEPIRLYDSVNVQNLLMDGISRSEAENVLNVLKEKGFLKKNSEFYNLATSYDESKLPKIPPYHYSLLQVFRICFAYRIALENIKNDLEKTEDLVYMKVISEPHLNLMWEMFDKRIIEPVGVKDHKSEEIAKTVEGCESNNQEKESIKNFIKEIIQLLAGSLQSVDTPSFFLQYIAENGDLPPSSPQELNNFMNNSLDFILKTQEKKYTLKMILSTLFVTIPGILEIAAGLAIQLFFAGALSYFGNVLINEGISDLMYACNCWVSGYFDWADYGRHKWQSLMQSLIVSCVNVGAVQQARYSSFGEKLAMRGVISESGKEIATLTGRELMKEVGGKAVAKEFGKQFIAKVGEGLIRGLLTEGNCRVIESYLQNLCNQLANSLLEDTENAVNEHKIGSTLHECCRVFGIDKAKSLITYHTEKSLTKPSLNATILKKIKIIHNSLSSFCAVATKMGKTMPYSEYVIYIGSGLNVAEYAFHLADIRTSNNRMLDKVDKEIRKEIEKAKLEGKKNKSCNEKEENKFKTEVINQWRKMLQEATNNIFNKNIVRPLMQQCTVDMARYASNSIKNLYYYQRNKYHRHVFNKAKDHKEQQLIDSTLSEETHQQILISYHDTLADLKAQVRDPELYADIVMEKGHMDAVCLKATSCVLNHFREDGSRPISIKATTDCGASVEFCTAGDGQPQEISLKLENQHFNSSSGEVNHNSSDYECLYRSLVKELPELGDISMEDFRIQISKEIKSNTEIHHDIKTGKHAFTLRRKMYGGHKDIDIATDELCKGLKTGKYFLSQSSVSERTSDRQDNPGIHLSELAQKIKTKYEGDRINLVEAEEGCYIFLDNRRIVAASTINNPEVKILARVFKYDEILPMELQKQYSVNDVKVSTAGRAAEVRIQRSKSFDKTMPVCKPYSPQEIRIRKAVKKGQVTAESITKEKIFFRSTREVGFQKYSRSRSIGRLG